MFLISILERRTRMIRKERKVKRSYKRVYILLTTLVFIMGTILHQSFAEDTFSHKHKMTVVKSEKITKLPIEQKPMIDYTAINAMLERRKEAKENKNKMSGTVEEEIYDFCISKGMSHAAACGVLGNIRQESGFNPEKVQYGGGPGRGLFQLDSGRLDNMINSAYERGLEWTTVYAQMEHMWDELNTEDIDMRFKGRISPGNMNYIGIEGHPEGVQGFIHCDDVYYATALFEAAYERAGSPNMENRYAYAEEYDQLFSYKK